jgi:beta-glucosidase
MGDYMKTMSKLITISIGVVMITSTHNSKAQNFVSPITEAEITALIKEMTLEEKVNMIHASSSFTSGGVRRLGIPELTTSDGPHGVRYEHGRGWSMIPDVEDAGTYLPTGNTLAATWNPQLGYSFGAVLGSEAKYRGKDVILGPGINIIRSPLNGRNFEYQSEDPYLVSQMVVGYIKGVQDQGISACVKHYAANNEEIDRGTVDVEMSERALREIYLPGFKAAVIEGGVNTVMGSYNKFRGQYATENKYLIKDILKGEWGFKGILMSDWGAVHNTMEAMENGTDLEMGSDIGDRPLKFNEFYMADTVVTLLKTGKLPIALVDDKVRRILRVMFKTHMINSKRTPGAYNTKEHQEIALKVAEEGIVLLKNEGHLLPLKKAGVKSLAVIGQNADRPNAMGGGSSQVKAKYEITPLQGLKNLLGDDVAIQYAQGYKIARNEGANAQMIQQAVNAASKADAAILFCGWTHGYDYKLWSDHDFDAEGVDKPNLDMPFGQNELIKAVLKANPNTIIVLMGGGPIDIREWIDQSKAIIEGWYPGMEGGNALAKIIFGEVNPSDKLPMTFPKKLDDSPAHKLGEFPGVNGTVHYNEGVFVGYRYFDTYKVEPQFAFGHGLSYTTFEYNKLQVQKGAGKQATVTLTVKNTGNVAGAEVVQIYMKEERPIVERPDKELKAFQKVFLKPGESKEIVVRLSRDAFSYYDDKKHDWVADAGKYIILAGSSSREIRATKSVSL